MAHKYNPLIDLDPTECEVNGHEYRANTDYRVVLSFLREQESSDSVQMKTAIGLHLFFGDEIVPDDIEGLIKWSEWFITRGEEKKAEATAKQDPVFDILVDSGRILAAFLQVYGINLRRVKMHWWTFCELLDGLPGRTKISEVIEIRRMKIDPKMKPSEKKAITNAKALYALKEAKAPMELFGELMRGIARN